MQRPLACDAPEPFLTNLHERLAVNGQAMPVQSVREVLSIASWVAAAVAAFLLYKQVLPFVQQYIAQESVALGVSVAGVFLITLIVVSYITMRISDFVLDSRIGALDRSLGFVFGALRGLLLVVVAIGALTIGQLRAAKQLLLSRTSCCRLSVKRRT